MGIVRTAESRKAKLEEFRQMLLEQSGFQRKDEKKRGEGEFREVRGVIERENKEEEEKSVCVTSGVSFVGVAIVNRLLDRGYSVRIAVDNEEDLEKLRDMDMLRDENNNNNNVNRVWAVMAKVTDIESLCEAFQGCRGVFHTSAFADPGGVSGYSKCMAELEVRAVENVMEACGRTESVKKCVFTSSLLTCIWRDHSLNDRPSIIDHSCWSDESICREKKLWFALGKTKAERAAWRLAQVSELKLATICQALVTGPEFCRRNPTASIAYLKGAHDMYAMGLLATVDVKRMAEAHVCVYEAMSNGASGRYICFDHMIRREEEAAEIERLMRLPENMISGNASSSLSPQFELCNRKLLRLMSTPARCASE